MSDGWGPGYGDPSHPTTNELPRVGDGVRSTGEIDTLQVDAATDPDLWRVARGGTGGFARVGDGRGTVGPLTVQIDRVPASPDEAGARGDTTLLPRIVPDAPAPPAEQSARPDAAAGRNMPVQRRQMGPDWTQTPLRLLAAAVVSLAVLGLSAASLLYIAAWLNP
ncbi:hypothetical protein [Glycomyces xiaoerkulensis]|uniref:hypothetical protein n=1 Tax=Glycomyces xiaoerkulensis TaxID=2038139 RepID=UPI000C2633AB|nr:hypothetical protein [Glycomyces xiaoerkulensis]